MILALIVAAITAFPPIYSPPPVRTVPLPTIDACLAEFTHKIFILRDMADRGEITEEQRRQSVAYFVREYLACKARQRAAQPDYIPYRDRRGID